MKKIVPNLIVYGAGHAIVDAACAMLVYGALWSGNMDLHYFSTFVILFNFLAFAMQAPLGLLLDKLKTPVVAALLGCAFTAVALFVYKVPLLAVFLAGIGNSLFHLGGGVVSLNLKPGKAAFPGMYVAPGALGLFIGVTMAKKNIFMVAPFILLLVIIFLLIIFIKPPQIDYNTDSKRRINYFTLIILLLLVSVCIRSLVGDVLSFPWKSNFYLLIIFTFAVFLGKSLGGILGDKFGWTKIAASGLLISAPLLAFGGYSPLMGIVGIFLFNMTMPVTLTAVSNLIPGRPGLAFGLTPLALWAGLALESTRLNPLVRNNLTILFIILASAFILFVALTLYSNGCSNNKYQKNDNMSA